MVALVMSVVLLCDQLAMPCQQSIGRDQGGDFGQKFAPQPFGLDGQSAALVIIEPQSATAQLLT
jgi:hypothetical protein